MRAQSKVLKLGRAGVLIGVINAVIVVTMRIDSFIGTLATGSIIQALITMVTGGTAIISNPMRAADIYALAARGQTVPRKSTSFGPKPRTGLVMRMFAQG